MSRSPHASGLAAPAGAVLALLTCLLLGSAGAASAQESPQAPGPAVVLPTDPDGGAADDPLTGQQPEGAGGAEQPGRVEPAPVESDGPGSGPLAVLGSTLLVLVSLAMTLVAGTTLWWMLHAWQRPEHLAATRFTKAGAGERPLSFTLLVPARHEEAVLGQTLDRLAAMDYPYVEVLAIVGDDDPGTAAVAEGAARRHPGRVRVIVDSSVPKNKPKGLNTALPHCTGDVVGVMDAEDEVHPQLLTNIAGRFAETGADVVQGGVQLMNVHSTWWSLRNCLEYYFWFRSRLHYHAGARFIPLGGNTVFIRTPLLREQDGWDANCLAEDCEIGVRLSTRGAKVAVAYDAELVTREETPGSLVSLVKQRTRWNQGFLQVLRKGIWKQLPTRRQRWLARYTLSSPFLQAFTGAMVPVSLALAVFAEVPTWVALISFLPLVPTLVTLAVEATGLHEFGRAYGIRIRPRDYLVMLLGTFPYGVLLAFAAVRAVLREARGDSSWEKTEHTGAHRESDELDLDSPAASSAAPLSHQSLADRTLVSAASSGTAPGRSAP